MAYQAIPLTALETLLAVIRATDDVDALKQAAEWTIQQLMEAEVAGQIGACWHERSKERTNQRNGSRRRLLKTRVGELALRIPKLRKGSYDPEWLLKRHKTTEKALMSVIAEAYANGVSTRKMDRLVREMGLARMDKSAVSRIAQGLDERVERFRSRPLTARYRYLWLDATFPKVREDGRVQCVAVVVAIGVREDGYREILGLEIGAAETETFWLAFLRGLVDRGLDGVQLVISDAHRGLQHAIAATISGAAWQRCTVHFMRNALTQVAKSAHEQVAHLIRSIFSQPTPQTARQQLDCVVAELEPRYPKVAMMLDEAREDLLAHTAFPAEHWRRLRSTNPLERLHREMQRRLKVVGIFPNRNAVLRLGGAVLLECHEQWLTERRYFGAPSMIPVLDRKEGSNQAA